ncbi:MAG: prenyltransferase/squalene oxidase repeat-containing protein [Candidatus Thorarchaeota archaeon]
MRRALIVLIIAFMLIATPIDTASPGGSPRDQLDMATLEDIALSADPGVLVVANSYIVLELSGGTIPNRGNDWSLILNNSGIVSRVLDVSDVISNPMLINGAPAILVDASVGSGDGVTVSQTLIDILVQKDISLILTGRAAWILHRLRGIGPPPLTAPATDVLIETAEYTGAVFTSSPVPLTMGTQLTSETGIVLPIDQIQTEMSRLVDLTGALPASIASLRFDSYPLDVFLLSSENPSLLTGTGQGLLQNTIAFSSALRETETATVLANLQAPEGTLLAGGFNYQHEPTISETYYAVYSAHSLLTGSPWSIWVSQNNALVQSVLETLLVDLGPETGFMTSESDGIINCRSTAQGLWLIETMGLSGSFNVPEVVSYISSRQDVDGGFENSITSTFHVTEALYHSGNLGSISTVDLESWLRSLVIDGGKTSDPDLWGSIGSDPTSLSATNDNAIKYLRSLQYIGKAHPDPAKLTSWILSRTSNGDGSFRNSHNPDEEVVTGTASALASMQILGTLSASNKTTGLSWFANNQLDSGGFGLKPKSSDLVAKTRETSRVAGCFYDIGETGGGLASGILAYVNMVRTDVGFETMDILPSLMWSSWILSASRLAHTSDSVDLGLAVEYLNYFEKWNMYPLWDNITTINPPEYGVSQYRTMSVWTQYFGTSLADALGVGLSASMVSETTLYLSQSQYMTGHYRPRTMIGTAHMQYSVAAVETLFLLDELSTIPYRTSLESAILSEYSSGSWDATGWTLEPFTGSQEAIDYLSTRAALRLGSVSSAMASEITAAIESRVQYTNILALSYDVATLSLLNSSGFSTDLESISRPLVLSALDSQFAAGWYNSSILRQPIFTESVLKMVSILGLRSSLNAIPGTMVIASSGPTTSPGVDLPVSITITSATSSHSVLVHAFGEWTLFTNVANSDTLMVPIPTNTETLGSANIAVNVVDWGASRAFDLVTVTVQGSIEGSLDLETPTVKVGENVNGTVSWSLEGGVDAGQSQVTIRLGVLEWVYDETSPYWFSVPTTGFDAGTYPLTITVERPFCSDLVLVDEVTIAQPNPTYISSSSTLTGAGGEEILIDWSLHFSGNSTQIADQEVVLTIKDSLDSVVFSDVDVSRIGGSTFSWIPSARDVYSFSVVFPGNYSLEGSQTSGVITVSEHTMMSWSGTGIEFQYSQTSFDVLLETTNGEAIGAQTVHVTVTAPSMSMVFDSDLTTNSTGHVTVTLTLSENGVYLLQADYAGSGLLIGSTDSDSMTSWSSSNLQIGGVEAEVGIGETCLLWAQLRDSQLNPIQGQSVTLRVILLPSTVISEQTLITNSSGKVTLTWIANSAGAYRFEVSYSGTLSRGTAADQLDFEVMIPVTFGITAGPNSEVGVANWIDVIAIDHMAVPISGLSVTIEVRGPGNELLYTDSIMTSSSPVSIPWTPSMRGMNSIIVTSVKQLWYLSASDVITEGVSETPTIVIALPANAVAPTTRDLIVSVTDTSSDPVQGTTVHCVVTLNGIIIHDAFHATIVDGTIVLSLDLDTPGTLQFDTSLAAQSWLLETSVQESTTVYAATTLTITTPGQPIEQGSIVGVVITLLDYSSSPLVSSQVDISITWTNGTILTSMAQLTDEYGKCILAQQFLYVGDFVINATYSGYGLNGSATDSVPQRVYVTPNIEVIHDPSGLVGDTFEIQVGFIDALGDYISGRTISVTVEQSGSTVFETQVTSAVGLVNVYWDPTEGGLATITILHSGDIYVLTNSTTTTASVLEHVTGELWLMPSQVDLFDSTSFVYSLTSGLQVGITIHFEVLGMDLVPVWSSDVITNSSGMATVVYTAVESHGVLRVNAGPTSDQFLIGGDIQELLIVMTDCVISTILLPSPPSVDTLTNITLWLEDELGAPIDGITVTVSLYDPYGEQVQLGYFTMSKSVAVIEGTAIVEFTPEMVGLYTLIVSSSGSTSVHNFVDTSYHTLYSGTQLLTTISTYELEVGEDLLITAKLTDHGGNPLVGRNITLTVDGPGVNFIGPIDLITNATGHIEWSSTLDDEGLWTLAISFSGLGVYLPIATTDDINVRYGTIVELALLDTGDVIAGATPASLSILLRDTGGTPLEGFTVHYEAHHETMGLVLSGDLIQIGTDPMVLNITLNGMGNYTLIVSFTGTTHYHASNAALQLWVLGRTEVSADMPIEIDRASWAPIQITITDEHLTPIALSELEILIELVGAMGSVNITDHLSWSEMSVTFNTMGLPVGLYTLNVTVEWSEARVGCISLLTFSVVSQTHIVLTEENLTGYISEPHTILFLLQDSLNETIADASVWVSIYNPSGREIFGSPLTDRTAVTSTVGGSEVSWNPNLTGEYRVVFLFEGDTHLNSSNLEIVIEVRYPSLLDVDMPELMEFGEVIPISATLNGALGKISGATIVLTISQDGVIEREETLTTNSHGAASYNLVGILSGNHTVTISFAGSMTQAPSSVEVNLVITPVVVLNIVPTSDLFIGHYCTVNLSVTVLGATPGWNGTLDAWLSDPNGELTGRWAFDIGVYTIVAIGFNARVEGTHVLNTTISGLPVIYSQDYPMAVTVVNETLQIQLDAGTTPLLGGFGILMVVGVVLRKKMRGVVSSLPGEWSE